MTAPLTCFFKKIHPDAVIPAKSKEKSRGYDLTIVGVHSQAGPVTFYTTGLILEPPADWEYNIYPRSGISKMGHFLVNGVGVVENDYRGPLLCALYKFDPKAPDLQLPCRLFQIVFSEPLPNFEFVENDSIDLETDRGAAGFGSTGFR